MPNFVSADVQILNIQSMRHPFCYESADHRSFISNDVSLSGSKGPSIILSGPNMGGKSTILRQTGIISILSHLGMFVPAKSVDLTPLNFVCTRIGSRDDMLCAKSTFMIEMEETFQFLELSKKRNGLILVDELGRGTSPTDG